MHGHDEEPRAAGAVRRIDDIVAEERGVLKGEGRQVAAADPEHRQRCGIGQDGRLAPGIAVAVVGRQRLPRRKQEVFQRVRADDVVEEAGRGVAPQTVGAAVLVVEPPGRQVGDAGDVGQHDRTVGDPRPDDAVAGGGEGVDHGLKVGLREPLRRADGGGAGHRHAALAGRRGVPADGESFAAWPWRGKQRMKKATPARAGMALVRCVRRIKPSRGVHSRSGGGDQPR